MNQERAANPTLRSFYSIWFGQLISQIGSGLTTFSLSVWVYQKTGSVTQFSLLLLVSLLPRLVLAPLIGSLVDRWDRRKTMLLGDTGAGLCTFVIALLFWSDSLQVWHLYVILAMSNASATFQSIAWSSSVALMVPLDKLGRANGLLQLGQALQPLLAPLLAAFLMGIIGVHGVVLIDFTTFLIAMCLLLFSRIPKPPKSSEPPKSILGDITFGWHYLKARPGLVGLVGFAFMGNFSVGITNALLLPLILTFASVKAAGTIEMLAGIGMLAGTIILGVWGGPTKKINGVLGFGSLLGVGMMLIGVQQSVLMIGIGIFFAMFVMAFVNGCSMVLFQSKVAPEVQGRLFAFVGMAVESSILLAYPLSGPLADQVFEPLLMADGALAQSLGPFLGTGKGRGMGLMLMVAGLMPILGALFGFLNPRVRHLEAEIPDAVHQPEPSQPDPETP